VLAWSGFNYFRHDYFTLSTFMGINLTNHTIAFVESVAQRHRETADILIRYREQKIQRTGRHAMAVWEALPELQAATGQSRTQISKQLASLSVRLILRHPLGYAQSVLHAWKDFWMVPILWAPDKLESVSVRRALVAIWEMEKWLLRILNASFLVLVFLAVVRLPRRARKAWNLQLTTVAAVILGSSLLQALVEYGENPRYAVTVEPLVILVIAVLAYRFLLAMPPSSGERCRLDSLPSTTDVAGGSPTGYLTTASGSRVSASTPLSCSTTTKMGGRLPSLERRRQHAQRARNVVDRCREPSDPSFEPEDFLTCGLMYCTSER